MALKFHREQTQVTRKNPQLWLDKFINYHYRIILTDAVINDLVDGLEFGHLLYLPKELCLNMAELVVSIKERIQPFKCLQWVKTP